MKQYELKNLKKYYHKNKGFVLNIPALNLDKGNFYVLYGPNGSGKTTLLNLLAFLDKPTAGEIYFSHQPIFTHQHRAYSRKSVTLLMEHPYLFDGTVLKNVGLGLMLRGRKKKETDRIIQPIMEELEIWHLKDKSIDNLSAGEKKRIAITRAIVLNTEVLLLDEPTTHLDKESIDLIEGIIYKLIAEKWKCIIMVTHDLNRYAPIANVIHLNDGSLCQESDILR